VSDRKYRQQGYQDTTRDRPAGSSPPGPRPEREPGAPAGARRISSEGAKNPRMMGYREVARCARCGTLMDARALSGTACPKCQQHLRSCVQCAHFDPSARFECSRPLSTRVSPKDLTNECALFEARTSLERETSTSAPPASSGGSSTQGAGAHSSTARKAFDDLFKF
jgi:DNA-directed RNA polymerase subunit RPC12/RpoP